MSGSDPSSEAVLAKTARTASDPAPPRIAAFFDVDGTLLRVQSGVLYISYLRRNGLMSRADQARIYWAFLTYRLGMLNMRKLVDVTSRWLRGREEEEVAEHCRQWYETEVRGLIRSEIVDLVRDHCAQGHVVALLTGGTHYLNNHLAADLDIEHVLASELEVVDGRFTGEPIQPLCYGRGKIERATRFAAERGVSLADSYFYTDSITDLPMLEKVGHRRIVDPDPRLRREAQHRGWELVDVSS
ncbi:MAG: HAD family hydrolase [Candidatus Binatia bacterium]